MGAALALAVPLAALAQLSNKELDTPYVPTPQVVVERMLGMAEVKAGDVLIDLGSGDGRLVITAAQKYGARGFGVEIDPRLVSRSNQAAERAGVADRVKFLRQDLFDTDFHEADVLTLYLLPDVNMALRPKILAELKAGARVVSHDYDMKEWRPDALAKVAAPDKTVGFRKESVVYLWIVPAKVAGTYRTSLGTVTLEQKYQKLTGTLASGGRSAPLAGAVRGEEISFTSGGRNYTGRMREGVLELR